MCDVLCSIWLLFRSIVKIEKISQKLMGIWAHKVLIHRILKLLNVISTVSLVVFHGLAHLISNDRSLTNIEILASWGISKIYTIKVCIFYPIFCIAVKLVLIVVPISKLILLMVIFKFTILRIVSKSLLFKALIKVFIIRIIWELNVAKVTSFW
jgi:hypothetical protein